MDFMGDEQLEYKLKEVLEADAHLTGRTLVQALLEHDLVDELR